MTRYDGNGLISYHTDLGTRYTRQFFSGQAEIHLYPSALHQKLTIDEIHLEDLGVLEEAKLRQRIAELESQKAGLERELQNIEYRHRETRKELKSQISANREQFLYHGHIEDLLHALVKRVGKYDAVRSLIAIIEERDNAEENPNEVSCSC